MERKSAVTALGLSIIPGAGHLYAGAVGPGIAWLVGVLFAYTVGGCIGVFAHAMCASSAVEAVKKANAEETADLGSRRESAAQVAGILDAAVRERGGPAPSEPEADDEPDLAEDPPPRMVTAGLSAPTVAVIRALADTCAADGLEVRGVDKARGLVKAMARLDGVKAPVVARVEPTPRGARIRMLIDRPAGSPRDDGVDDRLLRRLLAGTEQRLAGAAAPAAAEPEPSPPLPPMTEEDFFDELQEAWEAREQGWMPEDEWLARKAELVRDVMLRPETRESDFIHACRPLVEAGILTPDDLRAMEQAMRSR